MAWAPIAAAMVSAYMANKGQGQDSYEAQKPLPTYYKEYQSPQQQQIWNASAPNVANLLQGNLPNVPQTYVPNAPMPGQGWYQGLDPNVRAGIEEPYMRGMDMMRNQLQMGGQLGNQRAGMSGAAADVFGQYSQDASKGMAQTAWGMMQPGLQMQQQQLGQAGATQQQQGYERMMAPYQTALGLLPSSMSDLLVGTTPIIQQLQNNAWDQGGQGGQPPLGTPPQSFNPGAPGGSGAYDPNTPNWWLPQRDETGRAGSDVQLDPLYQQNFNQYPYGQPLPASNDPKNAWYQGPQDDPDKMYAY